MRVHFSLILTRQEIIKFLIRRVNIVFNYSPHAFRPRALIRRWHHTSLFLPHSLSSLHKNAHAHLFLLFPLGWRRYVVLTFSYLVLNTMFNGFFLGAWVFLSFCLSLAGCTCRICCWRAVKDRAEGEPSFFILSRMEEKYSTPSFAGHSIFTPFRH